MFNATRIRQPAGAARRSACGRPVTVVIVSDQLARASVTGQDAQQALRMLIVHTIGCAAFNGHTPGRQTILSFDRSLDWLINGITPSTG